MRWQSTGLLAAMAIGVGAWDHVSADALPGKIRDEELLVIAFVNPSDERSRYLEPEWQHAAAAEAEADADANAASPAFVSVDCAGAPSPCDAYGASASTAVKLFGRGGEMATYTGPRRASAIRAWARRTQRPAVTSVRATRDALEALKRADETVFVAFLDGTGSSAAARAALERAAAAYGAEFTFGAVTITDADANAGEGEGVVVPAAASLPALRCYRRVAALDGPGPGEEKEVVEVEVEEARALDGLDAEADPGAVERFVVDASRPAIAELLPHNHQRFLDRGSPMVYVFSPSEAERAAVRQSLGKLARNHYDSLTMVTADPLDFPDLPARLGLFVTDGDDNGPSSSSPSWPAGAVHQLSRDRVYPYPRGRGLTPSELQAWGLDVWQGRVRPWRDGGGKGEGEGGRGGAGMGMGMGKGSVRSTRNVQLNIPKIPGVNIKVGGRDEL
ncbi:thioredoxin-like domain-containing protein [Xylariaceae sp. FL0804]|nr:thioredoxin-like domain-containing protein [Xylariaceae sp. FL0804]